MEKTIRISGRIDTTNVDEIENRINQDLNNFDGTIIFDAEELEYISSAGLRMILRIKKSNNKTSVINCNQDIYQIFEMTGFTDMMDITKSYRKISIDNCEIIGDGFYGTVYRLNPETIVKVYKRENSLDMVKKEKELSRKAFVLGIPTAIPYDIVKVGNNYGSVFELLDYKSLSQSIQDGENIESIAKTCVDILKKIHAIELKPGELPDKKVQSLDMLLSCKDYLPDNIYNLVEQFINSIPNINTMIHGDFHVKNLMKQGNDILLIDMDTLSMGNPIFELSAIYATYVAFACVDYDNIYKFLKITYEQGSAMWNYIFNYYYIDKNSKEKSELFEKIKILGYLKVLSKRITFADSSNEFREKEISFCVDYLTQNIEKLFNME